ncbi:ABC transporter substrate-binding protein, partial [Anaerosinus sp.]|uniref:ABC transporter substrate-binding protein n=1 Tax=Selenobaculum sp. TaxID=3074374 RepID=UPI003AB34286
MSLLKENRYSIDLIRWLTRSNLFITTGRVNPIFVSALFIAFLFMTLFCVTACGKVEKSSITHPEQIAYEVVDDQGNAIKMLGKPQKIMTTHFYLDAMVLGIVPPERMVSISKTASDPAVSYMVKQAEKVQNHTSEISLETVVALSPDLIITREGTGEEMVQSYRDLGIPVFVIKMPLTVEGIKQQIHLIAKIVGEPDRGNLLVDKMERQLETI